MITATAEVRSAVKPLKLDLRGKTPDEVVAILVESGYSDIRQRKTDAWKHPSMFNLQPTEEDQTQIVRCIEIKGDEASNLTIIPYNGKEHKLDPGQDLYFFEGPVEGGWGWARTSYLYK
jgi:hypothetical protein